jgi:hypothetical protein
MLHAGSAIHTFTMNAAAALGRHLRCAPGEELQAVCRMVGAGVGLGMVRAVPVAARQRRPHRLSKPGRSATRAWQCQRERSASPSWSWPCSPAGYRAPDAAVAAARL